MSCFSTRAGAVGLAGALLLLAQHPVAATGPGWCGRVKRTADGFVALRDAPDKGALLLARVRAGQVVSVSSDPAWMPCVVGSSADCEAEEVPDGEVKKGFKAVPWAVIAGVPGVPRGMYSPPEAEQVWPAGFILGRLLEQVGDSECP